MPDEEQDALGLFFSVVVVDARDNHPQPAGNPDTALPLPRRGKRQIGHIAAARGLMGSKKKVRAVIPFTNVLYRHQFMNKARRAHSCSKML